MGYGTRVGMFKIDLIREAGNRTMVTVGEPQSSLTQVGNRHLLVMSSEKSGLYIDWQKK